MSATRTARKPAAPKAPEARPPLDNQRIYDLVFDAIAHRKLPPGTKLSEERLCRVFGVSRTRLREVFCRLAQDRIITLKPNHGAYVTSPSARDTAEVFAARRAIETAVVEQLARGLAPDAAARLDKHLKQESRARTEHDHEALTRLTGDFHLLLAELTGNSLFYDITRRLVALSSLIIALYDSADAKACMDHEHHDIVQRIRAGDADGARDRLMRHLRHVEQSLRLDDDEGERFDIESVFEALLRV
ncbi:GntR family transcriptional regulator [Pseudothauera nasutitermitis]|uniref:GntR family transcriptional regulator n=1 Tax=Pseudothauera nasutitermitis TaxID=2565930 RepID=A0A4S4B205_9RHOO|nr:GntR family transcriptional regulator [Pseudothauera nasutitermitis]THF66621.1 GntR family transcriptional regulator [Pseudothauera nasutitermitis]